MHFEKRCTISYTGNYFQSTSNGETIWISFEARIVHEKHPSELKYAYSVLIKIQLSSLAYVIVSVNNPVTYIANEMLTSRHNCLSDLFDYDLHAPKRLAKLDVHELLFSASLQKISFRNTLL
jgi:hypothetical protein